MPQQEGRQHRSGRDPDDFRMTIGQHLDELRSCIVRSLLALVLAAVLCAWPAKWVLQWTVQPLRLALIEYGQPDGLLATSPTEPLIWYIKVVLFLAVVIAAPYIIHQLWSFVAKGLYKHERRWVYRLAPVSAGLFLTGVVFMYAFVLYLSLHFLVGFSTWLPAPDAVPTPIQKLMGAERPPQATQPAGADATPAAGPAAGLNVPSRARDPNAPGEGQVWFNLTQQKLKLHSGGRTYSLQLQRDRARGLVTTHFRIGDYLSFVLILALAFGLAFQVPLVVLFLARTGIVPLAMLKSYRKLVYLAIVVIAAMIAPPDIISHVLLSVPMILLFEIGLLLAARRPAPRVGA